MNSLFIRIALFACITYPTYLLAKDLLQSKHSCEESFLEHGEADYQYTVSPNAENLEQKKKAEQKANLECGKAQVKADVMSKILKY